MKLIVQTLQVATIQMKHLPYIKQYVHV